MQKTQKDFFPNPEGTIGFTTYRTTAGMGLYLNKKLNEFGVNINTNEWGIIYHLFKNDSTSISEIAKRFVISNFQAKFYAKNLIKQNFVTYAKNNNSKYVLTLTSSGENKVLGIMPKIGEALSFLREGISPQEMIITINVLNKIYHKLYPEQELYQLTPPPLFEKNN